MWWILFVFVVGSFGFVVLFGAPYLPTLKRQAHSAVSLANLKPGQVLLELGCGDGKVMIAAAQQGIVVVGYELNPILVLVCKMRTWRYRKLVRVVWGNFFAASWPPADAIFVFLHPRYMQRLDAKIIEYKTTLPAKTKLKLISFAFAVPGKKSVADRDGVLLYEY